MDSSVDFRGDVFALVLTETGTACLDDGRQECGTSPQLHAT